MLESNVNDSSENLCLYLVSVRKRDTICGNEIKLCSRWLYAEIIYFILPSCETIRNSHEMSCRSSFSANRIVIPKGKNRQCAFMHSTKIKTVLQIQSPIKRKNASIDFASCCRWLRWGQKSEITSTAFGE